MGVQLSSMLVVPGPQLTFLLVGQLTSVLVVRHCARGLKPSPVRRFCRVAIGSPHHSRQSSIKAYTLHSLCSPELDLTVRTKPWEIS
jgi:hypothetical protein